MEMPFGKHRGVEIEDLPGDYLEWLHNLDDLHGRLATEVEEEWQARNGAGRNGAGRNGFKQAYAQQQERWQRQQQEQASQNQWKQQQEQAKKPPVAKPSFDEQDQALWDELVRAGYRVLAHKYHPDKGGDAETMRRVNVLVKRLREIEVAKV